MSWEVIVQNYRGNPPLDDDLCIEPEPLGTAGTIRKKIDKYLGGVVWSDSIHGIFEGEDFSIEFDIGDKKPITHIMLSVRGGGGAFTALKTFCKPNMWSLFDCSDSTFLDLESSTAASFTEFQEYRDRVMSKGNRGAKGTSHARKRGDSQLNDVVKPKAKRSQKRE